MKRSGVTLVELLIVVAVMTILMGIALPMVKHGMEDHRMKSAAEIVRDQFRLAAALAAERNEPSGVVLIVEPGSSAVLTVGVLDATPEKYTGDIVCSEAFVSLTGPTGLRAELSDGGAGALIKAGDEIQFDHLWDRCRVVAVSAAGPPWLLDLQIPARPPVLTDPPNWWKSINPLIPGDPYTARYQFVVYRKSTAVASKTELPRGACVDLSASGYGPSDVQFRTGAPVASTVIFDVRPDGVISSVRFAGGASEQVPMETIHLLIGELDGAGLSPTGVPENVRLPHARWIRIHPRTGRLAIVPNYWTAATTTVADARSLED